MKKMITLGLLGISSLLPGQEKLDITIIGTAHHFDEKYKDLQNFEQVRNFITELDPDIICMEAIPTDDTASIKEILPNTMKRADLLRDTLAAMDIGDSLVHIGAIYYSQYNFWNAYYYWHMAQELSQDLGSFSKWQYNLNNSEYGLMIFPAAQQMGVKEVYAIDYREGEEEFLDKNNLVLKKLLFKFKWKPLGLYMKTQRKYKKANKAGQLMEFINGPVFQNSFSNLIDEIPERLPKSEDAQFIKSYWLKRNSIMADRIVERARENKAKKILVTVGSAHVTHLKRFLEERGHQVSTYGQLIAAKNN